MNELYETLEICLNEIEQGADVDTVLFRYPELADELRPILEASVKARAMAVPAPSQEVVRRNRAKLLQQASQMREEKFAPVSRRVWSVPLRRALVSLMVVSLLFVSGTSLVRASSNTIPGDSLYPVKRTWEDVLVALTFNASKRDALELEHENERLDELHELFAEGRSAEVDFGGYVTSLSATEWRVSGITIMISPQTRLPAQQVQLGDAVMVKGVAQSDMSVVASRIKLLPPGSQVPEVEDKESDGAEEEHEGSSLQIEGNSASTSEFEAPQIPVTALPVTGAEPRDEQLEGVVESVENNFIVIDGVLMDIRFAEISGSPGVGVIANVEGYYDANGVFIVTSIEFQNTSLNSESDSGDSKDQSNDDKNNDNTHDDDNHESNDNESNTNININSNDH